MKTRRDMKTLARNGFTLAEIMISVSIIGIITAVALPNFFRIREEVNMEMVRSNLKTIHNAMNELLNQNGLFPDDIFGFAEEDGDARAAIAANLTAIDLKGFETTYQDLDGEYFMRSCSGALGRCFGVDPLGVHTLERWDGRGLNLVPGSNIDLGSFLEALLTDGSINDDQRAEILGDVLVISTYRGAIFDGQGWGDESSDQRVPSTNLLIPDQYVADFNRLFEASHDYLASSQGENVFRVDPSQAQSPKSKGVYDALTTETHPYGIENIPNNLHVVTFGNAIDRGNMVTVRDGILRRNQSSEIYEEWFASRYDA
jgi:prepilin-type N-terminal cleavage/methylation domain-containing protein